MRARATVVAIASVVAALGIGCGNKKKSQNTETTAEARSAKSASIELSAVPASAQVVLAADVSKLADSKLVQRAVAQMYRRDPGLEQRFAQLSADCGIDVARDVPRVVIGMGAEPDQVVLVAAGSFEETQLATCLNKSMAAGGGAVTSAAADGRTLYKVSSASGAVWLAVGGNGTVAVSPSQAFLVEALGSGPKVSEAEEMKGLMARPDRKSTIWGVGRVPRAVGRGLVDATGGKIAEPPRAIYGSLDLEGGLAARLGVVMAGPDDANALASKAVLELALGAMVAQKFGLGPLVAKIEAAAQAEVTTFSVDLSFAELDQILDKLLI